MRSPAAGGHCEFAAQCQELSAAINGGDRERALALVSSIDGKQTRAYSNRGGTAVTETRQIDVEMHPVDTTDAQISEEEEYAAFFTLNISGQGQGRLHAGLGPHLGLLAQPGLAAARGRPSRAAAPVPVDEPHRVPRASNATYGCTCPTAVEEHDDVNLLVFQDGSLYFGPQVNATFVLDNLIHRSEIPMTAAPVRERRRDGPGVPDLRRERQPEHRVRHRQWRLRTVPGGGALPQSSGGTSR